MQLSACRLSLISSTVVLCTACATGGSFETQPVAPPTEINTWELNRPKEIDKVIEDLIRPAPEQHVYGFSAAEPFTALTSLDAQHVDLSRATIDTTPSFDTLAYYSYPLSPSDTAQATPISLAAHEWKSRPDAADYSEYISGNTDGHYTLIEHDRSLLKVAAFNYTKVGAVEITGDDRYDKTLVNIFYKGSEIPEAMPVSGTASYDGYWERALETLYNDTHNGYNGNLLNASNASFTVDFSDRKMRGTLHGNNGERRQGYTINAAISGAGFSGTATPESYSSIQETASVSGSFFGPNAAELGGHLEGQQRRAVAVFAARQTTASDIVQGEPTTYASVLQADGSEHAPATNVIQGLHTIPFSGDIKTLKFKGEVFDLTQVAAQDGEVCCIEPRFQFMQTGLLSSTAGNADDITLLYFAHGHLTARDQVPVTGTASYKGRWMAFGRAPQGQAYVARSSENEARFTADFASRTLSGNLQGRSGADAIDVTATIVGNRFEGKASINGGLTADPQAVGISSEAKITGSSTVSGAFFGPHANELAGHFVSEDQSFGGVFGAKQQLIVPPATHTP